MRLLKKNKTFDKSLNTLEKRIRQGREIRLAMGFLEHVGDIHLKDLVVADMDEHRGMTVKGHRVINFGCDSYLGFDRHKEVQETLKHATNEWGLHNGASRMFYSVDLCEKAENKLAKWLGVESTLIFPSVTLANIGLIPAIVDKGDLLIVDRNSHSSIHEASKIAQANGVKLRELYPCRPDVLEKILAEEKYNFFTLALDGVYSMTGMTPPLSQLHDVVRRKGGALYIDDAHGTAVVGKNGRGAAHQVLGDLTEVLMVGSLSKGFSCLGAFVTCPESLKPLLKMKSSSYIFTGPVPPPYLAAICKVCDIIGTPEHDKMLSRLHYYVKYLADNAQALGYTVTGRHGPIVSLVIGDIEKTFESGKWLFDQGFYVQSAVFPSVPINESLLRILLNSNHRQSDVNGLLKALKQLAGKLKLRPATQGDVA